MAPIIYLKFTLTFPNTVKKFTVDQNTQFDDAQPSLYPKECLGALGVNLTSKVEGAFGYGNSII